MLHTTPKRPRAPQRTILALDLDCFYASVAIRSRPHLKDKPVVIVQKHLCVTSNYVARRLAHGAVQKMTPVSKALAACPDLVLIDGSDLTPFRAANAEVMSIVRAWLSARIDSARARRPSLPPFTCPCQRLGLDEVFIDATALVSAELSLGGLPWRFAGHVFGRTEDDDARRALMVASQLAASLRDAIFTATALTLCAGVSDSKLLAKLAVNMNKPNDQTTFLPGGAAEYVATLPPRTLPGFGYGAEGKLRAWAEEAGRPELRTAGDVVRCFGHRKGGLDALTAVLGNAGTAKTVLEVCRGEDASPVVESGDAPKSISSMDSFRKCTTMDDVRRRVRVRATDLVTRLLRDGELHCRRPKTLMVGFRFRGGGYHGTMRATAMPVEIVSLCSSKGAEAIETSVEAIQRATLAVLKDQGGVTPSSRFDLTLITIGATNFTDKKMHAGQAPSQAISTFFEKSDSGKKRDAGVEFCLERKEPNKPRTGTRQLEALRTSPESTCPVCNGQLPSGMYQASRHVDECLRRSQKKPERKPERNPVRKLPKTTSNTRRVDSFFLKR